jgi:acyl-CoA reductase-like NAD-dependent aldehyde dehydrogenase
MTEPTGVPPNPHIEVLRHALAAWRSLNTIDRREAVFKAAEVIVAEYDAQMAMIAEMMAMPRPSAEEIRRQFIAQTTVPTLDARDV